MPAVMAHQIVWQCQGWQLVSIARCAGRSNLPGDRRCTDWAGRTPPWRILMPSFFLFLPVPLHITWFTVSRKGHACDLCWCWWAHSAQERDRKYIGGDFCRGANADGARNSALCASHDVKKHSWHTGEAAACRGSSILQKSQAPWLYRKLHRTYQSISLDIQ